MNQKQQLINYLKEKNKILQTVTKEGTPLLTNEEDFMEIMGWSDEQVEEAHRIVFFALNNACNTDSAADTSLCPWCIIYDTFHDCHTCGYGKRHRVCTVPGSTYKITVGRLLGSNHPIDRCLSGGLSGHFKELRDVLLSNKEEIENGKY